MKGEEGWDLHAISNIGHALVSNKQEGPARSWLTCCSKPRACSCQQQAGRANQILTYTLFKPQSILLSATSRKGQPDSNLHPVQTPEHALVSNKQEGPARSWLTCCSKPRAWCCQQQAGRVSQILTYTLFKPQSMLLSVTSRKGQQNPDLHPVQSPEHALVSNKQGGPARSWPTNCWKPRACSCQQQAGRASQILTYILFKPQSMLLSATSRKGQQDPDLHAVQNPEHALVSNKQEGPAGSWLTRCSKPRACSCQQQAGWASQILTYKLFKTQSMLLSATTSGRACQILTYILFKTQSMLLSATSRKGQPDPDLPTVQNPEHALVSNKQEGRARSWLTSCSKPRACSCQQQAGRASKILTYKLFKSQSMLLWVTSRKGQPDPDLQTVQNPEHALVSIEQQAGRASQILTYILFKPRSMLLSATSRKGQQDPDLQTVQNPEHALVSNKQ